jgi:hypothetical protein
MHGKKALIDACLNSLILKLEHYVRVYEGFIMVPPTRLELEKLKEYDMLKAAIKAHKKRLCILEALNNGEYLVKTEINFVLAAYCLTTMKKANEIKEALLQKFQQNMASWEGIFNEISEILNHEAIAADTRIHLYSVSEVYKENATAEADKAKVTQAKLTLEQIKSKAKLPREAFEGLIEILQHHKRADLAIHLDKIALEFYVKKPVALAFGASAASEASIPIDKKFNLVPRC